jgi:DNA-binding FrmR family transcriptional regulator
MKTTGYAADKVAILKRLRRIEGQVRGVAGMIEDDRYCIEVLDQISAVTRDHLAHCVANAVAAGGEEKEMKLKEASAAINRLVRS